MNEEFMQRLAALEKKFQQAIREKEHLRKQLEVHSFGSRLREGYCRKTSQHHLWSFCSFQSYKHLKESSEFDEDKDQIIKELREEGEKLSKQQLSSNVLIKKLRNTEKDHLKLIASLK